MINDKRQCTPATCNTKKRLENNVDFYITSVRDRFDNGDVTSAATVVVESLIVHGDGGDADANTIGDANGDGTGPHCGAAAA